jgi:molybdate transport system ATP-binding protein
MNISINLSVPKKDFCLEVNFDTPLKGITALFGASGCGKTTLLRAIAGLEPHARGSIRIGNMNWQDQQHFTPAYKRSIGYVFQEPSLFPHLNVQRNLEYGCKRTPKRQRSVSLAQAIELLGIEALLLRRPGQLSGGEKQRVAIARALAVSPGLLLMDEPLAALDHARKQEILPYLESLHSELDIPVIYVSHSPDEIARLADHLVLMDAGKISATGGITDMLARLDLPLAQSSEAESLIEAQIISHDESYNLTYLEFPGGRFTVAHKDLPTGTKVRLRIIARDVSITLKHQTNTSILNIFPATVEEISPAGSSQVTIRLSVGGIPLLSRITRKSAVLLRLSPGKKVFAQAKSVALLA